MKDIVVTKDGKEVVSVLIDQGPFRIGRTGKNDLKLPDENVSRHQCELVFNGEEWVLKDHSGKGTKVDGKVVKEAILKEDSVIEAGGFRMSLRDVAQKDATSETGVSRVAGGGTEVLSSCKTPDDEVLSLVGKVAGKPLNKALGGPVITLGSDLGNVLIIEGRGVSKFHAKIYPKDGKWRIEDLDSTNGTKLNDIKIKDAEIQPGQMILLGDVKLFVVSGAVDEDFPGFYGIVSVDPSMEDVFDLMGKVAPTDEIALIRGEVGTGKGLVAKGIYSICQRSKMPLLSINCASFQKNLIDNELFGHKKGAFTGADSDMKGIFDAADKGTLFMDEIGEMPLEVQAKILKVIEEGEVKPVGENFPHIVDTRIIAATHRSLIDMVKEGSFRKDLYYRMKGIEIDIPPLRSRPADIPLLARFFLKSVTKRTKRDRTLSDATMEKLQEYRYPGNVRELKHLITVAAITCDGDAIEPDDIKFSPDDLEDSAAWSMIYRKGMTLKNMEEEAIRQALAAHEGNRKAVASDLAISRSTLQSKMEKFGIE